VSEEYVYNVVGGGSFINFADSCGSDTKVKPKYRQTQWFMCVCASRKSQKKFCDRVGVGER